MARSNTPTLLPLDRYAEVMGISLVHFNNLRDDAPTNAARPWWGQAAHDELAVYIAQAEAMLRDGVPGTGKPGLGFDVAPVWRQDRVPFNATGARWWESAARTPFGYIQACGRKAETLVKADAAVSYANGQGTLVVTVPSGTLAEEVQVFYRVADGAVAAGDPSWRIRPLTVTISGTTATIAGHQAMFVLPSVLSASAPAEYTDPAVFVTAVDVYRVTTDTALPVSLVWDQYAEFGSGDPSADYTMSGTARLINAKLGRFQPRPATIYDGSAHTFEYPSPTRAPDWVEIAYRAGYPLEDPSTERLDGRLEVAVVRLANVLSPEFAHWLNDPAQLKWRRDRLLPNDDNPLQPGEQDCPFGLTDGARFVWRTVRQMRLERMPF